MLGDRGQFQFLLGRLETNIRPPKSSTMKAFQFLLGRLETGLIYRLIEAFFIVSIPLR